MSNDAMTNDPSEYIHEGSVLISMTEITRLQYTQNQKRKDDIIAENKFGFVVKQDHGNVAFITHDNKCYRGVMRPWHDPADFQAGHLDMVQTAITAVINRPEPKAKPTKTQGDKQ